MPAAAATRSDGPGAPGPFAWLVAACLLASPALAEKAGPSGPAVPARPAAGDSVSAGAVRLARAQAAWRMQRPLDVARELQGIDFSSRPAFEGSDRAAFLLAQAWLRLGDRLRFEQLAVQAATWTRQSDFTRALAHERALLDPAADATEALRAGGAPRLLNDAQGAEHFRTAADRIAAGEYASDELARVPGGSAHASAAKDLDARLDWEAGHHEHAAGELRSLLERDSSYALRREIAAMLADDALRRGEPKSAFESWKAIDAGWTAERDALRALSAQRSLDSLVTAWEDDPARSGAAPVPARRAASGALSLGRSRADAHEGAGRVGEAFDRPERIPAATNVLAPGPDEWSVLAAVEARAGSAAAAAVRASDDARVERERLDELKRYLGTGQDSLSLERARIESRLARLAELRSALDAIDAQLRGIRDAASLRVVRRAAAILAQCEANERWVAGLDHFWVKGPAPRRAPAGYAGSDSVVAAERELVNAVGTIAARIAAEAPATIARSYQQAWRPGTLDRIARQSAEVTASLGWSRRLAASLDSSLVEAGKAAHARSLEARAIALGRESDSLSVSLVRSRDAMARRAVERTLAAIQPEREAIDYGLAASAWAVAASLDHANDATAADSSETRESPEAAQWRDEGITRLQAYLANHPEGEGRADARYRLADLLEQRARVAFRGRMEEYMRAPSGAVPVLETAPSITLHRAILAGDPHFAHRDAVLFDLGTLLAERGETEATQHFRDLVNAFPASPLAQESWLRLADEAFDERRFLDAVPLYQAAVEGTDTTLRVIALYKLGWTEFHVDHFDRAAGAFGEVLDLYAAGVVDARIRLDDDAEVLFVHTLARAGGAEAFAAHFDRIGPRPYELKLLLALGQHFRKYTLFGQAVAADQLLMDRHPLTPEALVSAQRMDETYRRWQRPDERQAALLANAARFEPGAPWIAAQASDSLRAAGDAFARAATLEVAWQHHLAARQGGPAAEWSEAARLEEHVLATWPADASHRALHLQACESRAAMGDIPAALAHADSVAVGRDTLAAAANLQRVAILDTWYERSRPDSAGATGSDSVAHAVIAAGDALLEAFPADPNAPGVRWRQAQLTFAHGWFDLAADRFGAFAEQHPSDPRAARAATLRADVYVKLESFDRAQEAYEKALALARRAGDDSLALRVERAIPACAYKFAEAKVAADSTDFDGHAARFENIALRWPAFEHADVAYYRAGLAWFRAGHTSDGARAMGSLATAHPKSVLVRDAGRATAAAWEAAGDTAAAAQSWLDFAARFATDPQADDASLRSADFFERAHEPARADSLRLAWIRRHPDDHATDMALLEPVASRSLDSVTTERPVSRWLPAGKKGAPPRTSLADYLSRASKHPEFASRALLARVKFLEGEEASAACSKIVLRQPLAKSIGARKAKLDLLLARYKACIELGEPEWAHAAAFRIGEALVSFGDAIEASERPADLSGEDRAAYDEVIHRQSDGLYQRAEGVWSELLDGKQANADDPWLARARASLEPRMASRAQSSASATPPADNSDERNPNP